MTRDTISDLPNRWTQVVLHAIHQLRSDIVQLCKLSTSTWATIYLFAITSFSSLPHRFASANYVYVGEHLGWLNNPSIRNSREVLGSTEQIYLQQCRKETFGHVGQASCPAVRSGGLLFRCCMYICNWGAFGAQTSVLDWPAATPNSSPS